MTISTNPDNFEVECDFCGITEEFEKDLSARFDEDNGFFSMIEQLKADGWKIYKSDTGEWSHLCPGCNIPES